MTMPAHVEVSVPPVVRQNPADVWECAFPGRGKAVMDVLGPCHASSVSIGDPVPGPSVRSEGVLETARDVYHWLVQQNGLFGRIIEQRYLSAFRKARIGEFQWLDTVLAKRYPLQERIPDACLRAMAMGNADGFEHLGAVLPVDFRIRLWESYMSIMQRGLAYAISGGKFPGEAAYFTRLIRVWHGGCPPVGYGTTDRGVEAVVFIARDQPFP